MSRYSRGILSGELTILYCVGVISALLKMRGQFNRDFVCSIAVGTLFTFTYPTMQIDAPPNWYSCIQDFLIQRMYESIAGRHCTVRPLADFNR